MMCKYTGLQSYEVVSSSKLIKSPLIITTLLILIESHKSSYAFNIWKSIDYPQVVFNEVSSNNYCSTRNINYKFTPEANLKVSHYYSPLDKNNPEKISRDSIGNELCMYWNANGKYVVPNIKSNNLYIPTISLQQTPPENGSTLEKNDISNLCSKSNNNHSRNRSQNYLLNRKIIGARNVFEILNTFSSCMQQKHTTINFVNTITALHRIAKHSRSRRIGKMPFSNTKSQASDEDELRIITQSLSQPPLSSFKSTEIFERFYNWTRKQVVNEIDMKPIHIANLAWSMAVLNIKDTQVWSHIFDNILLNKGLFKPQEISIILWAIASAKITVTEEIMNTLLDSSENFIKEHSFKPQELCNALWALIIMKIDRNQLNEKIIDEALRLESSMAPIDISTLTYSLSIQGEDTGFKLLTKFLDSVASRWYNRLISNKINFANMTSTYSIKTNFMADLTQMEFYSELYSTKYINSTNNSKNSDTLEVTKAANSTDNKQSTKIQNPHQESSLTSTSNEYPNEAISMDQLIPTSELHLYLKNFQNFIEFKPQDWSILIWSCANGGLGLRNLPTEAVYPKTKRDMSNDSLISLNDPYKPLTKATPLIVTLCNLLYFQMLCGKIKWSEFSSQSIANLLWGLAILDYFPEEIFFDAIREVSRRDDSLHEIPRNNKLLAPRHRAQLFQAVLAYFLALRKLDNNQYNTDEGQLIAQLSRCKYIPVDSKKLQDWQIQLARNQKKARNKENLSSTLHNIVSMDLSDLDIKHTNEYFIAESFIVDISIPEEKLIIEVYGPTHFYSLNNSHVITSKTLFKQRILQDLGWKVAIVPFFNYEKLQNSYLTPDERKTFLRKLLKDCITNKTNLNPV